MSDYSTAAPLSEPCTFVIFGASGDLTRRLLVPALYNLAARRLLPERFSIIGVSRGEMSADAFRADLAKGLREFASETINEEFATKLLNSAHYVAGDVSDPAMYERLAGELSRIEVKRGGPANRVFYLATPPRVFAVIGRHLGRSGLAREDGGWRRIIVEKPFGSDLASAKALNKELLEFLSEHQIYRMDHYLGKETVQNILVLRFANGLFEPIWNRHHIDHVQITVAETLTVGRRGKFYDATGALRDMVPNHLFQLLSLVTMEPPSRFDAHSVRSEKTDALDAVQVLGEADALRNSVRAQYTAGCVGESQVEDYRNTPDVKPDSIIETYVALKLMIESWRWAGVPFYLRTGKALKAQHTEVAIKFRQAPITMFRNTPVDRLAQNFLIMSIQPHECIGLQFNAKVPGPTVAIEGVGMTFNYADFFDAAPSTGYETLIYDCMLGDAMLFQPADGVEAGWRVIQPFSMRGTMPAQADWGRTGRAPKARQ
jgi:glucose-6-phosphate 1-dehydrogenase